MSLKIFKKSYDLSFDQWLDESKFLYLTKKEKKSKTNKKWLLKDHVTTILNSLIKKGNKLKIINIFASSIMRVSRILNNTIIYSYILFYKYYNKYYSRPIHKKIRKYFKTFIRKGAPANLMSWSGIQFSLFSKKFNQFFQGSNDRKEKPKLDIFLTYYFLEERAYIDNIRLKILTQSLNDRLNIDFQQSAFNLQKKHLPKIGSQIRNIMYPLINKKRTLKYNNNILKYKNGFKYKKIQNRNLVIKNFDSNLTLQNHIDKLQTLNIQNSLEQWEEFIPKNLFNKQLSGWLSDSSFYFEDKNYQDKFLNELYNFDEKNQLMQIQNNWNLLFLLNPYKEKYNEWGARYKLKDDNFEYVSLRLKRRQDKVKLRASVIWKKRKNIWSLKKNNNYFAALYSPDFIKTLQTISSSSFIQKKIIDIKKEEVSTKDMKFFTAKELKLVPQEKLILQFKWRKYFNSNKPFGVENFKNPIKTSDEIQEEVEKKAKKEKSYFRYLTNANLAINKYKQNNNILLEKYLWGISYIKEKKKNRQEKFYKQFNIIKLYSFFIFIKDYFKLKQTMEVYPNMLINYYSNNSGNSIAAKEKKRISLTSVSKEHFTIITTCRSKVRLPILLPVSKSKKREIYSFLYRNRRKKTIGASKKKNIKKKKKV